MRFLTAVHTDAGLKKEINQDSMILMRAESKAGNILLAAVCDGMGGLAKGEEASAMMVKALARWFEYDLPVLLEESFAMEKLWEQWNRLIDETGREIADYAMHLSASAGTTAAVLLMIDDAYYIMNVGDSRIYLIRDQIWQLTKDQTYVQREIDAGRMTPAEAARDPQRNVLLQCIGASRKVIPDFTYGKTEKDAVYMLCSDGFRHCITPKEIHDAFQPSVLKNKDVMEKQMKHLTQLNKERKEDDNISCILIRTM